MDQNLFDIFFPHASSRHKISAMRGQRFVYYTSAETAMNIISNKELWMRNATCMNDFTEVQYGINCFQRAYHNSDSGTKLKYVLHDIFPDICKNIEHAFNGWMHNFKTETYLTCVSEHDNEEDTLGRLSMWRAYGRSSGVALVFKSGTLLTTSGNLKALSSPVGYFNNAEVEWQFNTIAENISRNKDFVRNYGAGLIEAYVFDVFKFAILSIKHPGFKEEKEWRIIYNPALQNSNFIKSNLHVIDGTPQHIYKLPLIDIPDIRYFASIANILDRVIIGPVAYPNAVHKAFIDLLINAGITDPYQRVFISDIPLRR